jgi:tetratricopeptide (TPR) repeat protein
LNDVRTFQRQPILFAVVLSLLFPLKTWGQFERVDSLWQAVPDTGANGKTAFFFQQLLEQRAWYKPDEIAYAVNFGLENSKATQSIGQQAASYKAAGDLFGLDANTLLLAIFHYKRSVELAEQAQAPEVQVNALLQAAYVYRNLQLTEKLYPIVLQAEKALAGGGVRHRSAHYKNIGDNFYVMKKWPEAVASYQKAIEANEFADTWLVKLSAYNNWGLALREMKQYNEAVRIFEKALQIATDENKAVWTGIIKGNIGGVHKRHGNLELAKQFLLEDFNASQKSGEHQSVFISATALAEIAITQRQTADALRYLQAAEQLAHLQTQSLKAVLLRRWSEYYASIGDWKQAFLFKDKTERLQNTLDSIDKAQELKTLEEKQRFLMEEGEWDLKIAKAEHEKQKARDRFLFLLALFGVSAAGGAIAFVRMRRRNRQSKQTFETRLEESRRELDRYTARLREKSRQVETLESRLGIARQTDEETGSDPQSALAHFTLLTDEDWSAFKKLFDQVHSGFIERLSLHEAHFSPAEIRLLALLKLGLSGRETADTLGITLNGVKKARQRLRKKLSDWPGEKDLIGLLLVGH